MVKTRVLSSLLAFVLMPSLAGAVVIVANTEQTGGGITHHAPGLLSAANFISPSMATTLTSVDVPLTTDPFGVTPTVTMALWSDVGGEPGVLLVSLGSQVLPGDGDYTFTPAAPFDLAPSTSYWLVFGCTDCSQVVGGGWETGSAVPVVAGLPGADVPPDGAQSDDGGVTWDPDPFVGTLTFTVNGFVVGIDLTEIPTVSEWGLGLLALILGFGGWKLTRR